MDLQAFWLPPVPTKQQLILEEALTARAELLCLLSWFNEISCQDSRFEELTYRLSAAEKMYQVCLEKVSQEGISRAVLPYLPSGLRRGITLVDCWYGW